MQLSVLTDSDDLAEYYLKRLSDVPGVEKVKKWLERDDDGQPARIQAWKERHRPKPGD
jgi:hypothetical protein